MSRQIEACLAGWDVFLRARTVLAYRPVGSEAGTDALAQCVLDAGKLSIGAEGNWIPYVYNEDGTVSIELHIIVENGVNLVAVCRSIMSEVRYVVSKTTGVEVKSVDVCVDSMRF